MLLFFSFLEISWVSGREEAMRVPPSETVAHQRPDHRLWPSTGTLLATGLCAQQAVILLDQKTPNRPKDCPAGSWSRWDTIHFTPPSVNGIEERGYYLKLGWDHRLVIKCCPLTLWFSAMSIAVMAGFCSAVKGSDDTVKAKSLLFFTETQNRCDLSCFLFHFYSILYLVRTKKRWFIKSIKLMVQSVLGEIECY